MFALLPGGVALIAGTATVASAHASAIRTGTGYGSPRLAAEGSHRGRAAAAVRAAVEDDAAVWAKEVREAGRFSAGFLGRCRRVQVLVAEPRFEPRTEALSPKRRLMADVLPMAAGELGDPHALCVHMEADDRALHPVSVRGGAMRP